MKKKLVSLLFIPIFKYLNITRIYKIFFNQQRQDPKFIFIVFYLKKFKQNLFLLFNKQNLLESPIPIITIKQKLVKTFSNQIKTPFILNIHHSIILLFDYLQFN